MRSSRKIRSGWATWRSKRRSDSVNGEKVEPRIDTGVELVTRERLEKEPEIRKLVGLE